MSFFNDLGDMITGDGKRDLAAKQLETELALSQKQLELQDEAERLKMDPDLAKVKNIRYIVLGLLGLVLVYVLVKYVF